MHVVVSTLKELVYELGLDVSLDSTGVCRCVDNSTDGQFSLAELTLDLQDYDAPRSTHRLSGSRGRPAVNDGPATCHQAAKRVYIVA